MQYSELFDELKKAGNPVISVQMAAYMKNKFEFLGIPSSERKKISNKYLKEMKKSGEIDWDFVFKCINEDEREFFYVAIDYLLLMRKHLTQDDMQNLIKLITVKSWWDSFDAFHKIFAELSIKYPDVNNIMIAWNTDNNIWLRRSAIIYQLSLKNKTNKENLQKIICNNFGTDEFFINKAVGWSLREYSKTDADWVRAFITTYKDNMSKLSIKEAVKYI